jgi:hypothetical protein
MPRKLQSETRSVRYGGKTSEMYGDSEVESEIFEQEVVAFKNFNVRQDSKTKEGRKIFM